MKSIPKIVHQIYWNFKKVGDPMPKSWALSSEKCRELYEQAGWEYRLWGKGDAYKLINDNFPWLRKKWMLSSNIEKVDILRYAIMYVYGGMYLDLDTECLKLYPVPEADIILGGTTLQKSILSMFYGINNNVLLSKPNHPFWECILHRINTYSISDLLPSFIRISLHTGPYCLQSTYEKYPNKTGIIIEPELSVSKTPDSSTYFIHDSTKSWVSIPDAIHLGVFIVVIPLLIKPSLCLRRYYLIFSCVFMGILTFLLCRKSRST
jgi:mannosyltransferase OCH1-like enzyme